MQWIDQLQILARIKWEIYYFSLKYSAWNFGKSVVKWCTMSWWNNTVKGWCFEWKTVISLSLQAQFRFKTWGDYFALLWCWSAAFPLDVLWDNAAGSIFFLSKSVRNLYRTMSLEMHWKECLSQSSYLKGNLRGTLVVQLVKVPAFTSAVYFIWNSAFIRCWRLPEFITVFLITTIQSGYKVHICHVHLQVTSFQSTNLTKHLHPSAE